jgi:hypothetical protein
MSKGIFLAVRRCCQQVRVKVWHPEISAELVEQDVMAVLHTHGVVSASRRRGAGGPATPPVVTFRFKLAGGDPPVVQLSAQLRQAGYEPF